MAAPDRDKRARIGIDLARNRSPEQGGGPVKNVRHDSGGTVGRVETWDVDRMTRRPKPAIAGYQAAIHSLCRSGRYSGMLVQKLGTLTTSRRSE